MKYIQSITTAAVLGNAAELTAQIMMRLNNGEISQTFGGSEAGKRTIYDAAQVAIQQELNERIAAGV